MNAPLQILIQTSAEWAKAAFALYQGEIAWEKTPADTMIMIVGDGKPVNGPQGGYTRLRRNIDDELVTITSFPFKVTWLPSAPTPGDLAPPAGLDPSIYYLCRVLEDNKVYKREIGADEWVALDVTGTETTVKGAFDQLYADFYQLKESADREIDGIQEDLDAKTEQINDRIELIAGEGGELERLDALIIEKTDALAAVDFQQKEEYTRLFEEADGKIENEAAQLDLRIKRDVEALEKKDAELDDRIQGVGKKLDESIIDAKKIYAPLNSPHFTGQPEVPNPFYEDDGETPRKTIDLKQAVPVGLWKELFDLTMETSGFYLRTVDTDTSATSAAAIVYQRKLDTLDSEVLDEILRETDHVDCCDDQHYVTQDEYDELYDLVMDTSGQDLRAADSAGDVKRRENRAVDTVAGLALLREVDKRGGGGGTDAEALHDYEAIWVE